MILVRTRQLELFYKIKRILKLDQVSTNQKELKILLRELQEKLISLDLLAEV